MIIFYIAHIGFCAFASIFPFATMVYCTKQQEIYQESQRSDVATGNAGWPSQTQTQTQRCGALRKGALSGRGVDKILEGALKRYPEISDRPQKAPRVSALNKDVASRRTLPPPSRHPPDPCVPSPLQPPPTSSSNTKPSPSCISRKNCQGRANHEVQTVN